MKAKDIVLNVLLASVVTLPVAAAGISYLVEQVNYFVWEGDALADGQRKLDDYIRMQK